MILLYKYTRKVHYQLKLMFAPYKFRVSFDQYDIKFDHFIDLSEL